MNYVTSRNICLALGLPFVAAGLPGFIPIPVSSPDGLFEANLMHSLLQVLVGAVFIIGAMLYETVARRMLQSLSVADTFAKTRISTFSAHVFIGYLHSLEFKRNPR